MEPNPYSPPKIPSDTATPGGWRFIERRIVNGEQEVVFRYLAIYSWMRWPVLTLMILTATRPGSHELGIAAMVALVAFIAMGLPYWPAGREIKRQMRVQPVTVQGSRYSLSNPLTYRWRIPEPYGRRSSAKNKSPRPIARLDPPCGPI